jgi:hypothetical protein
MTNEMKYYKLNENNEPVECTKDEWYDHASEKTHTTVEKYHVCTQFWGKDDDMWESQIIQVCWTETEGDSSCGKDIGFVGKTYLRFVGKVYSNTFQHSQIAHKHLVAMAEEMQIIQKLLR